ncbi:MAG: mechanosensitive ion channel [bacterium]|nr:mechanosensitive ion channel [bacterium]
MKQLFDYVKGFEHWFHANLAAAQGSVINELGVFFLILLSLWVARWAARRWVLRWMIDLAAKSPFEWDDALIEFKVVRGTLTLVLLAVLFWAFEFLPSLTFWGQRVIGALIPLQMSKVIDRALSAGGKLYLAHPIASRRPIKGFLQLFKILAYLVGGLMAISVLMGVSPLVLLSGFGAMTAVLILVFKDLILSVLASIHIAANDLIQQDDWLEVPQYQADGTVIELALYTLKIQNWDKTISVIPTYKILETPFKNWRGMTDSGGRRIKRSIFLDQQSMRFEPPSYLVSLLQDPRIATALEAEKEELLQRAEAGSLTNLRVFRKYLEGYLRSHPKIADDMTFMVRQLQPTPQGLPLEIYVFVNEVQWVIYEQVQAELIEEILAMLPRFELSVFQAPSGRDLREAGPAGAGGL